MATGCKPASQVKLLRYGEKDAVAGVLQLDDLERQGFQILTGPPLSV